MLVFVDLWFDIYHVVIRVTPLLLSSLLTFFSDSFSEVRFYNFDSGFDVLV
jgi:hypothetical protein